MIVNPEKFQAIILGKTKQDETNGTLNKSSSQIKVASQLNLFEGKMDNKLNLAQKLYFQISCKATRRT